MYEELIKALRGCVLSKPCDDCPYYDPNGPTKECATMNIAAADAIEELSREVDIDNDALTAMDAAIPRWIPVTERLPEQGKRYLVIRFDEVTKTQFIDILWHDAHDLWWNRLYMGNYNVTHWMPLPTPPKEET